MGKRWICALAGLVCSFAIGVACATAQQGDVLLYKGKQLSLSTNPLAGWLQAHPDRELPQGSQWSSNWRGYIATWEIQDGALWLRKVTVRFPAPDSHGKHDGLPVPPDPSLCKLERRDELVCNQTRDLFPEGGDIRADWFTGTLIVPTGEATNYVHMGYGSTYSRYLVVWIREGQVVRELDLTDKQFTELRRERFKAYQQTEAYKKEYASSVKRLGEDTEEFLYQFHAEEYLSSEPAP